MKTVEPLTSARGSSFCSLTSGGTWAGRGGESAPPLSVPSSEDHRESSSCPCPSAVDSQKLWPSAPLHM